MFLERFSITFTANKKCKLYHVTKFFVFTCRLLLLYLQQMTSFTPVSIHHENWFRKLLSPYFLFLKIVNVKLKFAFFGERDSKSLYCNV